MDLRDRYLDLLAKTLSFSLWPEPPVPYRAFLYRQSRFHRIVIPLIARLLKGSGVHLYQPRNPTDAQREEGRFWPGYADTMIGLKRLANLRYCVETALAEGIPGDLIETGVWRGGACIFMRGILAAHDVRDRRVFVADSFRGIPPPDPQKYPVDAGSKGYTQEFLAVSRAQVEENFRRYGLLDEQVVFLEGSFRDTLPTAPIERLAVLRLDGDMYESTMVALEHLYPKLSPGGFCIVDDYALKRCKPAVDDYRKAHGIEAEMNPVDWTGMYWRKP